MRAVSTPCTVSGTVRPRPRQILLVRPRGRAPRGRTGCLPPCRGSAARAGSPGPAWGRIERTTLRLSTGWSRAGARAGWRRTDRARAGGSRAGRSPAASREHPRGSRPGSARYSSDVRSIQWRSSIASTSGRRRLARMHHLAEGLEGAAPGSPPGSRPPRRSSGALRRAGGADSGVRARASSPISRSVVQRDLRGDGLGRVGLGDAGRARARCRARARTEWRRRRTDSAPRDRASAARRGACRSSSSSRDFPTPGSPTIPTAWPAPGLDLRRGVAQAPRARGRAPRSGSARARPASRAASGARPSPRSACDRRPARSGPGSTRAPRLEARRSPRTSRAVASLTRIAPGSAICCRRAARWVVSPTAV